MPRRVTPKAMQAQCDRFNAVHQIGETIKVCPGAKDGRVVEVRILEPMAHVLGGHTAVVQVSGGHGCIALSHVVI